MFKIRIKILMSVWPQVVVQLANTSNFICEHRNFCHPNCYERQRRSCSRLMMAIRKIYGSQPGDDNKNKDNEKKDEFRNLFREKMKRRVCFSVNNPMQWLQCWKFVCIE